MNVREALLSRKSARAFLPRQLPKGLLEQIVDDAKWAPSGGNMQPWHVYGVDGDATRRLLVKVAEGLKHQPRGETPEFLFFPEETIEPYTSRRLQCAEDMFSTMGTPPEDKEARIEHVLRNYQLFGAPAGLFFAIDRRMDRNHWAHLGMYVQSVMLLAWENGLDTCPQEAWATQQTILKNFFDIPENLMIFCGVAVGYADQAAPVNTLRTRRADFREFAKIVRH